MVPHEQRSFLSFDGTPIGYQVMGNPEGAPFLLANGLGGRYMAYRFIVEQFGDRFRFYCYDYRGMYTSGRPLSGYGALTVEAHAKDALALLDHEGIEQCFALGWSMGVQVLLETFRYEQARISGLILHNGVSGKVYETLGGQRLARKLRLGRLSPALLRRAQRMDGVITKAVGLAVEQPWLIPLLARTGVVNQNLHNDVFTELAGGFKDLDMHLYIEVLRLLGEHDASDVLDRVRCPTLMIASTHDVMTPLSAAKALVDALPNATLEIIPGGTHYAAVEFPDVMEAYLSAFFHAHFPEVMAGGKEQA